MLKENKLQKFNQLIEELSKEELIWVNGYLAGLVANGKSNDPDHKGQAIKTIATRKISLVYGTETGNSKRLATLLATNAKKKGIHIKLTSLDQYRWTDLEKEEYLFVVISTQGEGEPPATAKLFYDKIHHESISLTNLKYSVLALGDSSYPFYCKTGIDVDNCLQSHGAKPVVPLQKCDVDYEDDAQQWFHHVLAILDKPSIQETEQAPITIVKKPTGKKIYTGHIRTNINLNDRGSHKQTFHIEITAGEKIDYEAGDALGIIPANKKIMVDLILGLTGIDKDLKMEAAKDKHTIEELLTRHLNICYLHPTAIKKYAAITRQSIPDVRMDLVDLVHLYPLTDPSQFEEVLKILSPIAPRLYSISSSPAAHGAEEIHLTVSRHSFRVKEEQRFGLCSDFLGELPIGTPINFYIRRNRSFKLPASDKDIIMIGPGTGVAPFRGFLSERDATGTAGRNWLFFGDQHFTTDFLYQAEMQNLSHTGVLTNISLAFSRDQPEKVYVQHRILQHAEDLFEWINSGASIYVCGTKDPNSRDIENALIEIIAEQGQLSNEKAKIYLKQLENENRYVKDVY